MRARILLFHIGPSLAQGASRISEPESLPGLFCFKKEMILLTQARYTSSEMEDSSISFNSSLENWQQGQFNRVWSKHG